MSGYKPCKNTPDYIYRCNGNLLQIAKLSTAKVIAQISTGYIEEFCYDRSKNIGAATYSNGKACIIDFSKNSIIYDTSIYNGSSGNNHINMIGSIIVYNTTNTSCVIYDYNIKKEKYISDFREGYGYHNPLVVNNNLYISSDIVSSGTSVRDLLTLVVFGYEGYDSTKYYQIKNKLGAFVKVK